MQCITKLFGKENISRQPKTEIEKFQLSVRVTAKCRFSAAQRLKNQSKFAFFSTTCLSLGLIFIPLIQTTGISLAFPTQVLNMISVFFAVAVLVYSIVIGTARYDLRSDKLTQCGNNLKELNRKLGLLIEIDDSDLSKQQKIDELRERYTQIISETENHQEVDYQVAILDMPRDYELQILDKMVSQLKVCFFNFLLPYTIPLSLLLLEIVFISDMLFLTRLLPTVLRTS